jgi:hypothetical protein
LKRFAPVAVLFLLAPFVGELLLGATPVSRLGGLLPLSAVYGGGAVLIRELVRRRRTGWVGIALLGAAYAIVEEGFAVQSFFNPMLFRAGELGGRALGVNWVWTEWTIGYHVVWSVGIPILLAELLFPARRNESWLPVRGTVGIGLLYAAGVFAVAAIFRKVVTPDFHTPTTLMAGAVLASTVLIAGGLWRRREERDPDTYWQPGRVPAAWLLALTSMVGAVLWFGLLGIPSWLRDRPVVVVPMLLAVAMLFALAALVGRWRTRAKWTDVKWLALASGALAVNAAFGFFFVTAGNAVDHIGQGFVSVFACVMLLWFAAHVRRRVRNEGAVAWQPHTELSSPQT